MIMMSGQRHGRESPSRQPVWGLAIFSGEAAVVAAEQLNALEADRSAQENVGPKRRASTVIEPDRLQP